MNARPHTADFVAEFVAEEFAELGILDQAYVKDTREEGRRVFAVHAADGSFLGGFHDRDTAFAALRLNDMEGLSVH